MQHLNNKNKLLDLIAQGATVITPNNRLSAELLLHYFNHCNTTTIDKPTCLPYNSILVQAYQRLKFQTPEQTHPTLLNSMQCQQLWRNLLMQDTHYTYSEGLLSSVMQAWEHCLDWQIDPSDQAFLYTPQTRQFQQWWNKIDAHISELNVITEHQLIAYFIKSNQNLFSTPVVWVCFDNFTPQQQSLQNYLNNNLVEQYQYDVPSHAGATTVFAASDNKQEYQQLIDWLQLKRKQGQQRIGVVIPDLQDQAQSLQRLLTNYFPDTDFDISLGQALGKFPLIAHALSWLTLDTKQLLPHQAALLLQSPYIGHAQEEFLARSHYLQESALLQDQNISLTHLIQDLVQKKIPKLAELLALIKPYPESATVQDWIQIFQQRLNLIGFPGDYGLNSENYQCFNRFMLLFDEFRQFSILEPNLSALKAIEAFTLLINNTIFQAQKTKAPIQICGLLEASGCTFDSLWVMGLTDNCLPQKTRLSAFIPQQMQRELEMPHSVPANELKFAQQTLQRLQNGSKSTVFSYSRLTGDNPNLPCSLITQFPTMEPTTKPSKSIPDVQLVHAEENYLVPLNDKESITGGTSLLANQAKCPFKAFAEHRLKAQALSELNEGLSHLEKGQIIHKVMELIWQKLLTHEQLIKLSTDQEEQLIHNAIQKALADFSTISSLILEIETVRLKRLVQSCLQWEKQRPPFTVAAIEQAYSINLSGLDFKVRVDRLDQVGTNKWVIDYKSRLPTAKPWNEERPQEPQLLLYALLEDQINTLLLIQLKSGQFACSGVSEEKQEIKGIGSLKKDQSWQDCRDNWHQQLNLLAQEFKQGQCQPQPSSASVCAHCDFISLCRYQIA